ncbi:PREDICTED: uncharacterized membrane protein YCR023C-like [Branchiostoma belcheri]|uniref:Uncharacterized membrane protein YCR023C-like n=1 Tax=Branchiostoma belcheri TaxID=7741 RepID=A0A6P4ZAN1_BRABE|nr:PREDICTED: uncharacterized membrane protein YCR023C-like [Branchiostoma belcheri]
MWGKLADRFGRRPTLLAGSLMMVFILLMFGFSFSFAWAVFTLFLGGLLTGTLGIAKTYLYEVCPAKMHALAFAVVSVASGLAYVVGPTVGGFLSCPAARFSSLDTPVFRRFPYLLPCIASMLVALVGLLVGFFFLEETRQQGRKAGQITAVDEINLRVLGSDFRGEGTGEKLQDNAAASENYGTMTNFENQEDVAADDTNGRRDLQGKFQDVGSTLAGYQRMEEGAESETDSWPLSRLVWDRRVMLSSLLYGLLAFVAIAVSQLLPLLLVSGYDHGGFGMDSRQISIVVSVLGAVVMADQVLIVPWLTRRFKYTTLYKYGLLVFAFGVLMIPLMAMMTGPSVVLPPLPANTTLTSTTVLPSSQPPSPSAQTTPSVPSQAVTVPTSSSTSPPQAPVTQQTKPVTPKTETPMNPSTPSSKLQTQSTTSPQPQVPATPSPQVTTTPSPQSQVPATPSPQPQIPATRSPQITTTPSPQITTTPSPQPQISATPSPQPQVPGTPSLKPQVPNPEPQAPTQHENRYLSKIYDIRIETLKTGKYLSRL